MYRKILHCRWLVHICCAYGVHVTSCITGLDSVADRRLYISHVDYVAGRVRESPQENIAGRVCNRLLLYSSAEALAPIVASTACQDMGDPDRHNDCRPRSFSFSYEVSGESFSTPVMYRNRAKFTNRPGSKYLFHKLSKQENKIRLEG